MSKEISNYLIQGNVAYQPESVRGKSARNNVIHFPGNPCAIDSQQRYDDEHRAHLNNLNKQSFDVSGISSTNRFETSEHNRVQHRLSAYSAAYPLNGARVKSMLDSSEMYCSLKYESLAGINFGTLSKRGVALWFALGIAIAFATIAIGM